MEIINIKNYDFFLDEYILLCHNEWSSKTYLNLEEYIQNKKNKIKNNDKVISILGLIEENVLIGFISLFKYDDNERKDLTPWYATMYVKKEYRGKGYSKKLNDAILNEARLLGYNVVYLKTNLENYYEKFGAIYLDILSNGDKLYYFELKK